MPEHGELWQSRLLIKADSPRLTACCVTLLHATPQASLACDRTRDCAGPTPRFGKVQRLVAGQRARPLALGGVQRLRAEERQRSRALAMLQSAPWGALAWDTMLSSLRRPHMRTSYVNPASHAQ